MKTCLFVMEDWPITPVVEPPMIVGGASSLIYSHLELMSGAVDRVILLILSNPKYSRGFELYKQRQPEVWKTVSSWCHKVHIINIIPGTKRIATTSRILVSLIEPAAYAHWNLINSSSIKKLDEMIESISPDFIWAEHLIPITILNRIKHKYPLVYSHHDWVWKIQTHRNDYSRIKQKVNLWFHRKHETRLVQKATACVSGSATELDEIRQLGAKYLCYLPATYMPVELSETVFEKTPPRIVHLGGMRTTANKLGLQRFMEIVWPILLTNPDINPELWIIGSLEGASTWLLNALKNDKIICSGVVPDLRTVLRPNDIHIIPWEYNTGTRTRIPLVLNYAQALVSTREASSCLKELEHEKNCILVDDLKTMATAIVELYRNKDKRFRIARSGRETFLNYFTREKQQPRFNTFIDGFLKKTVRAYPELPRARKIKAGES